MAKTRLTGGKLLAAAAPLAAAPLVGKLALDGDGRGGPARPFEPHSPATRAHRQRARRRDGPRRDDRRARPPRSAARTISTRSSTHPPALPYEPGRVREYELTALDTDLEVAPGVFFPAWTYNGTAPGPVIRATEGDSCGCASSTRGSHPHTIHFHGIHPTNMDGVFEIVEPGGQFTYEFEARPGRRAPLPLPRDAAEEAHPQGPLRRVHHRPEGAAPAGAGARDGDERLRHRRRRREQLLHRQRALVLLRAVPDPGEALRAGADLPREPHRVRPHQLVPPARGLLPLPADRHRATTGSTRTP